MADYEVENLKITLSVDDSGVSEKITSLQSSFKGLSDSIRSSVGEELKRLGEGFKVFSSTLPDIGNASEAIKKFVDHIGDANFDAFSEGLVKVGNAFSKIQLDPKAVEGIFAFTAALRTMNDSANAFNTDGIEKVVAASGQLDILADSVKKASSVGSGLRDLAVGLRNIPSALKVVADQDFHTWAQNVTLVTSRLRELNTATGVLSGKGVHTISTLASALNKLAEFGKDKGLVENLNNAGHALVVMATNMADAIGDQQLRKFKELTNSASRLADAIKQIGRLNFEKIMGGKGLGRATKKSEKKSILTKPLRPEKDLKKTELKSLAEESAKGKLGAAIKEWDKYYRNTKKVGKAIQKTFSDIAKSYAFVAKTLAAPIKFSFKVFSKSLSTVAKGIRKVSSVMSKPFTAPFKAAGMAVVSLHKRFTNFLHSVGRIAIYRAIRSGIKMITNAAKEGIENLYNWASIVGNDFKPTMDSLASSALYVKNSLAAMASPLLDALAPAFEVATDTLVEFMNKLNQLFATLTGKDTWRKAIRREAEYSAEIDNTGRALDDLQKTILGIDEINPLNGQNDRGRGSSDITPDYEGMFEVVDVTDGIADMFKSGDWSSIGSTLTDGLITALGKLDWTKIKKKATTVGSNLASFVNGALGKQNLWTTIASTISGGMNTATSGLLSFTSNVDWTKIGNNLAAGFRNAVSGVTWSDVGKTAASGVSLFAQVFNGFVSSMTQNDWNSVGDAVASAVNGAIGAVNWEQAITDLGSFANGVLNAILTAAGKIKWQGLGDSLTNGVIAALGKIKWKDIQKKANGLGSTLAGAFNTAFGKKDLWTSVGTTISNGLNTAVGGILNFTTTVDWTKVGSNIADGFKSAVQSVKWADVGKAIGSTVALFTNLFHGFVSSMTKEDWEDLGGSIATAIGNAVSSIDFEQLIPDLVSAATGILTSLVSAIGQIDWGSTLSAVWEGVKQADWKSLFSSIGDFLAQTWPVFVIPLAFNAAPVISSITSLLGPWGGLVTAILTAIPVISLAWEGMWSGIINNAGNAQKQTAQETDEYLKGLYETGRISKEEYEKMSGQVGGMMNDLENWVIGAEEVNTAIGGVATKTGESVSEIKRYTGSLTDFWKEQRAKLKADAEQSARESAMEFKRGLADQKPKITQAGYDINSAVGQALQSGDPWTWGDDFGYLFSRGIIHSAEAYIAPAASNAAASARQYMAFSKPERGPLSDADTYGPDFMELFAEGMEKKAYLIENAARNIAAMADAQMSVSPMYNSTTNAMLGADSTALIRSVAQGAEDANAAQNELLREQNELLRQILARTGDGVSAGTIMSSMERASRRAGVAVA